MADKSKTLEFGEFYHIYNRGNNKEELFKANENYYYFLKLYQKYIMPIADLYAYCLLPNHFHFLIRIKSLEELNEKNILTKKNNQIDEMVLSRQFSNFFNSYSKSFNSIYKRNGSLFQRKFGRIKINSIHYLTTLIYYIHYNPEKHLICKDFYNYKYSSFNSILSELPTKLKREEVFELFGSKEEFISYHNKKPHFEIISEISLE